MALPNRLYIMLLSHVALSGNHKLVPDIYMLNFNKSSGVFQTLAVWKKCYIIILIMVDRTIWNTGVNFIACYLIIYINQLNKYN